VVAYSFRKRFVEPIRTGSKRQTIRADRKRHARPGELMQLYCGMRTRGCFLIDETICDRVQSVRLSFDGNVVAISSLRFGSPMQEITGAKALDLFATQDGFGDWNDMRAFWREEHGDISEWRAVLLTWNPLSQAHAPQAVDADRSR